MGNLDIDKMRADGWVLCEDRLPDGYVDVLVIATEWVNDNYTVVHPLRSQVN